MSITLTPSLPFVERRRLLRRCAAPEYGLEVFECGCCGLTGTFSTCDSGRNHAMPAVRAPPTATSSIPTFPAIPEGEGNPYFTSVRFGLVAAAAKGEKSGSR